MGVDLGDLFPKRPLALESLKGRTVAVDAHNVLYQFLSIIRQPDGTPLRDSQGRVTSHLSGLIYRTTNLVEAGVRPVFVFDGRPPPLKRATLEARAALRQEAEVRWEAAARAGDDEEAFRWAQASSRVTRDTVAESKGLLEAMGVATVQAPSEGEAQAAHMARKGDAWAAVSQDFDSLLFGAPRLVRNLAVTGRRKLPRRNLYVNVEPEEVVLEEGLGAHGITREQLIALGVLVGTDFHPGIRGVGPKKALKLVKEHGTLEKCLAALGQEIENGRLIEEFFRNPDVADDYDLKPRAPRPDDILRILCDEHDFSRERVEKAVERLKEAAGAKAQKTLFQF
ncbi:MAG: flap endonuclease-1 [Halobacteria archaeon]